MASDHVRVLGVTFSSDLSVSVVRYLHNDGESIITMWRQYIGLCDWNHTRPSNAHMLTVITNYPAASHLQSHPCLVSCSIYYAFLIRRIFIYLYAIVLSRVWLISRNADISWTLVVFWGLLGNYTDPRNVLGPTCPGSGVSWHHSHNPTPITHLHYAFCSSPQPVAAVVQTESTGRTGII